MEPRERIALWFRPAFYLGHNAITLTGAVLTTSAALTMIGFWVFEVFGGGTQQPYVGILIFLILPGFFLAGLVMVPFGVFWRRRKLRASGTLPDVYPRIDLGEPALRRAMGLVAGMTVLNVAIFGTASYRGVHYMESVQFCGLTCHTVMAPEYSAYQNSPHQRVSCTQCHIGPGAPWFVRSKLSGLRQVFAVTFKTYSRPIPSPVQHLRPARETCEQCHWPQKFTGDKFLVRTKYSDDEANTPLTTVMVLKIGGRNWQGNTGIHGRHLDVFERISYTSTDGRRQVIPLVSYLDDNGKNVDYVSSEVKPTPEELSKAERRKMDCMDCHNRPTHAFELPEPAVDKAMNEGRISTTLPYIKKKAVELLRAEYASREAAEQRIIAAIDDFYKTSYPDVYKNHRSQVEAAADNVKRIYLRNIFPEMKVTWGTHPNNIGHQDFLGCFRCHDGSHTSSDGRTISQDCDACHTILTMEDPNPKILKDLGLK
jgi:nitrate/TMAO reductase-like tetraheme cytochrome c subunit